MKKRSSAGVANEGRKLSTGASKGNTAFLCTSPTSDANPHSGSSRQTNQSIIRQPCLATKRRPYPVASPTMRAGRRSLIELSSSRAPDFWGIFMTLSLKSIFQPAAKYDSVRPISIYLLRLVFILMFFVLGKDTWTHILTHKGTWNPGDAIAWCVWPAFATLAGLGIFRPLKMLPILLLGIFYKGLGL